jgi:integrase
MPNVYPKKGTKYLWCWGHDVNGKRWDESTKQTDPKAAKLAAREIERRYAADPGWKAQSALTLKFAMDLVLKYQRDAKAAPATIRATEYHARHLIEILKPDTPLPAITLNDTTAYLDKRLAQGASRHTISKELKTLAQAMRRAEKRGLYRPEQSPKHFIPDELGSVYKPRDRWLTRTEYEKLLVALAPRNPARDQRITGPRKRAAREDRRDYVIAYCNLGLRKSELFDVLPGDYDHQRRELRVRGTKTDGADRLVPVNEDVAPVLQRRCDPARFTREQVEQLRRLVEKKNRRVAPDEEPLTDEEAALLQTLDKPFRDWTDGNCTRDLTKACARAGIARVTPNDLRRTFCSWLCQAGVPERVCAELMGHESTVMVRAVYGHLDREGMAAAVARIAFPQQRTPSTTAAATAE